MIIHASVWIFILSYFIGTVILPTVTQCILFYWETKSTSYNSKIWNIFLIVKHFYFRDVKLWKHLILKTYSFIRFGGKLCQNIVPRDKCTRLLINQTNKQPKPMSGFISGNIFLWLNFSEYLYVSLKYG